MKKWMYGITIVGGLAFGLILWAIDEYVFVGGSTVILGIVVTAAIVRPWRGLPEVKPVAEEEKED